ncbi:hypothetical protein BN946_scf185015.g25 [Trametes cinnabarina]|uniref:Uncharacterized protein n=1 Tax=Pycnoporus cinnabarinus TaxID=5643 RepID=A0A060SGR2_PYCCI|nr:hypothetical protein BN946_scf185015.g25 [Trametes cinnabarina]
MVHHLDALAQHRVYEVEPGRVIDTEKPVIPNASSAGLAQLAGPLADFNAQIKRLQARCRLTPVVGAPYLPTPHAPHEPSSVRVSSESQPRLPADSDGLSTGTHSEPTAVLVTNIPSPAPEEAPLDQPAVNLDCEDMWEDDDESAYWAVYEDAESMPFSLESEADVALDMDLIDGN